MNTNCKILSLLWVLGMMCYGWGNAQTVTNVTAEQVGKTIHVSYDLDRAADISLFVSTDGGGTYTQLYKVSGDEGKAIPAGRKTVVWDVLAEWEKLDDDDIKFKVKAQGKYAWEVVVNGVSFNMIYVDGGTFTMGCTSVQGSDCANNERPAHQVMVSDFYMGETEVTQALWKAVMGSNPSCFRGDDLPVENVSWNDCQEFILKLSQLTGKTFRLPTEAEWEYAARGGKNHDGYKYAGANSIGDVAWCWNNSIQTHLVATKLPNAIGLYDMSGNVKEWCSDWYGGYISEAQRNPTGPLSGSSRVQRGGSWPQNARPCRVSYRSHVNPSFHSNDCGFRLAWSPN